METYPRVLDENKIGDYPAYVKSGGGYVWDEVLEYRVWCHPLAKLNCKLKTGSIFMTNMSTGKLLFIINVTVILGLLNVIYHSWTDWQLGVFIGHLFNIDLTYEPSKHLSFIILNSLYSGPRLGILSIIQIIPIMLLAGYSMTRGLIDLYQKQKLSRLTVIVIIALWIVKVPVPVEYSNFYGISLGLFAW